MPALLIELAESVRPEFVGAIEEELARLDRSVAAAFCESVDLDRSFHEDRQGIGCPTGWGELAVPEPSSQATFT